MKRNKIKKVASDIIRIFKYSFSNFSTNRPVQLAGTTAYFAIFSLVPAIIIIISVFGYLTGNSALRVKLFEDLEAMIGSDSTVLLQQAIDNYNIVENSAIGTIFGIIFFFISATALFGELQNSINFIWRVKVKKTLKLSILNLLKTRVFSFAVILGLGILLFISLIVDASIEILRDFLSTYFSTQLILLAQTLNLVLSLAVVTVATAFIYKFLPDLHVNWSAAWFGAIITAVLFAHVRLLLNIIIRNSEMGVVYGAAGSIVIILIWVFFVSIIFYFGVELTHQYSLFYGHHNNPRSYAGTFEIHSVE